MPGASTPLRVRPVVVLLGLLALALNLRAALAGYPPLLGTIRGELGVSAGASGLVQASVVLMMAAGSFAGSPIGAGSVTSVRSAWRSDSSRLAASFGALQH